MSPATSQAEEPRYRGPYILMTDSRTGREQFTPAKHVEVSPGQWVWVALSKEEIAEQTR